MYIKYSPCKSNIDTSFQIIDDNTIIINGEEYEFDISSISWPDIRNQTNGSILEAHRESDGSLYLTIIRKYTDSCVLWDNGSYTLVEPTPEVIETPPETPPPPTEEPPIETPPPEPILEDPIVPPEGGI